MEGQLRHFAFTYNNYDKVDNWEAQLCDALNELGANYVIWGKEIAPTTGTPHLQGYVQLRGRKYFSVIRKCLPNTHITIVRGSSQDNVNYCKKIDTDYYESGELRTVARGRAKQKADWSILLDMASEGRLDEIRELNPREYVLYYRTWNQLRVDNIKLVGQEKICLWVHGKPGVGKSRGAWKLFPESYPKGSNKWWCGYQGELDVILDDLGTHMLFDLLKRWTDRYKVIGEVKTASCALRYVNFVVTSNYSIRQLAMKSNSEVDEITIQAIQRRFVEVEAVGWDEEFEDLLVISSHNKKEYCLRQLYAELNFDRAFKMDIKKCYEDETSQSDML